MSFIVSHTHFAYRLIQEYSLLKGATNTSTSTARRTGDGGWQAITSRRTGQWSSRLEGGPWGLVIHQAHGDNPWGLVLHQARWDYSKRLRFGSSKHWDESGPTSITAARGGVTSITAARGGDPKAMAARGIDTRWQQDWLVFLTGIVTGIITGIMAGVRTGVSLVFTTVEFDCYVLWTGVSTHLSQTYSRAGMLVLPLH